MGYNGTQKLSKDQLFALIAQQPDVVWPTKLGTFFPPKLPTIAGLRKALKGNYGYGPGLEVCLRQPASFSLIRQVIQAEAPPVANFPSLTPANTGPGDQLEQPGEGIDYPIVELAQEVPPLFDPQTVNPPMVFGFGISSDRILMQITAGGPCVSPTRGPSTANLDALLMTDGLPEMFLPIGTATLRPDENTYPPTNIIVEDPCISPMSGPSTTNHDAFLITDGLPDMFPPIDTPMLHPGDNTCPPTNIISGDPYVFKSGPSTANLGALLMTDGLYTLPDEFPLIETAPPRLFSTWPPTDDAIRTGSEPDGRQQQTAIGLMPPSFVFGLTPDAQRLVDIQKLQDFTNSDPHLAQSITLFRSMKNKTSPTTAHMLGIWEIGINFQDTMSKKRDWPDGERTIPVGTIQHFLDRTSGWFSQVRPSVMLIRKYGPSSANKVDKIINVYNGPSLSATVLRKALGDIGAELVGQSFMIQ